MDIQVTSALIGAIAGALFGAFFGALSTVIINKLEWRVRGRLNFQYMSTNQDGKRHDSYMLTIFNFSNYPIMIINAGMSDKNKHTFFFHPENCEALSPKLPVAIKEKSANYMLIRKEAIEGCVDLENLKEVFASTSLDKTLHLKGHALRKSQKQIERNISQSEDVDRAPEVKQESSS